MVERARSIDIPPATVRRYVEENFSLRAMVDAYLRLYRDVLEEKTADGSVARQRRAVA